METRITGILMASGFSRRFSEGNKLLQPFRGEPLIVHTLRLITGLKLLDRILLVCAHEEVARLAEGFPVEVVENRHPEQGKRESIRLGVEAAQGDGYLFCPCDQPLLDAETVERILQAGAPGYMAIPTYQSRQGAPVLFSSAFRQELLSLKPGEGGKAVQTKYPEAVRWVPIENPWALADVDTWEDLCRLEAVNVDL